MWFLDTAGGRRAFASRLCGELLSRSLSSRWFTSGLLGTCHCSICNEKKKKYSIDVRIVAHTVDAPRARRSAETQKQIKIINKIQETRELFRQTEQSKLHAIIRVKRCSSRAAIETGRAEWGGDLASDWPGECSGTAQRGKSSRCAMERSRVRPVYLRQRANKNSQRWKKKRREQERSRFFVNRTSPTVSRFARVR